MQLLGWQKTNRLQTINHRVLNDMETNSHLNFLVTKSKQNVSSMDNTHLQNPVNRTNYDSSQHN